MTKPIDHDRYHSEMVVQPSVEEFLTMLTHEQLERRAPKSVAAATLEWNANRDVYQKMGVTLEELAISFAVDAGEIQLLSAQK